MKDLAKLRIIPLGGIGEIGKNMTAFEYGDDVIVVDCGSIFPRQDMLGIDLVIPDIAYLINNRERVRAYLFTHGHEDHIGAVPYVFPRVPAPAYGTKLTCALIRGKLAEHNISGIQLNVVKPRDTVQIGAFTVQFIKVSHSIAGAVAMAITCPAGTVIVTGDFKIDYTPIDGEVTDLGTLAAWGNQGVLALLADSTNVERPGYTMSEKKIAETFRGLFKDADKRIIIAMFASNLHRIQQVVDLCVEFGRRICFVGRSMVNVTKLAMDIGEIKIPREMLVEAGDLDCYDDDEIVVLTTGSQGEPMSGLTRMANSEHRKLQIRAGDTVIVSATPIPGNEIMVSRIIDQLYRIGANVIYNRIADVHVSGHACQEELKLMQALVRPKYFIPVHGEYRMLQRHAEIAVKMGMPADNAIILELGQVLELSQDEANITGPIQTGSVMVDGLGVGDVGNVVLRDRKHLSQDGLIIVIVGVSKETGQVTSGPELISRGFVYVRENEELISGARSVAMDVLSRYERIEQSDWTSIKNGIKDEMHTYLLAQIKRNPMILPIIMET
ncbi:MAG: ribonuclease J [Candidatus Ventricola sp.]|nr:ribonuclease J [Candidatus Ventricola sp.]MDY4541937.1 ribonuclease J [Candidatus Ventricola sp.]MDY4855736.1 ribonuclease J [Candidatus Ventricola sp.]